MSEPLVPLLVPESVVEEFVRYDYNITNGMKRAVSAAAVAWHEANPEREAAGADTPSGDDRTEATASLRMHLGAAVRRAMAEATDPRLRTQVPLADALGVDQTTVSRWVRGSREPQLHRIVQLEDVCGLPRGQVLLWAGLVDMETVQLTSD